MSTTVRRPPARPPFCAKWCACCTPPFVLSSDAFSASEANAEFGGGDVFPFIGLREVDEFVAEQKGRFGMERVAQSQTRRPFPFFPDRKGCQRLRVVQQG